MSYDHVGWVIDFLTTQVAGHTHTSGHVTGYLYSITMVSDHNPEEPITIAGLFCTVSLLKACS